jgi:hypothetical protein
MNTSAVMVLVPNADYQTSVPDPHLTLGYFGKAADLLDWQLKLLREVAVDVRDTLHKHYWAKKPKVNGRGVFLIDPEFNDGNKFAYVDLIDHNVLPVVRGMVEERLGFSLNRGHGFTPHMTVAYGTAYIPDLARPDPLSVFTWKSVELWLGDEHEVFPCEEA